MKKVMLYAIACMLCGCGLQQPPKNPSFGNPAVYTTPGTKGGVTYTVYEVTPL